MCRTFCRIVDFVTGLSPIRATYGGPAVGTVRQTAGGGASGGDLERLFPLSPRCCGARGALRSVQFSQLAAWRR